MDMSMPESSSTLATVASGLSSAREIRDGVEARFGIRLVNEPVLVGCAL
jgi:UDP-N-acetylmuramate dehydrogenase